MYDMHSKENHSFCAALTYFAGFMLYNHNIRIRSFHHTRTHTPLLPQNRQRPTVPAVGVIFLFYAFAASFSASEVAAAARYSAIAFLRITTISTIASSKVRNENARREF